MAASRSTSGAKRSSKSSKSSKSGAKSSAKQTAPLGETEPTHRARTNAIGAAAGEGSGTERATEVPSPDGNVHPAGNLPAIQHEDQPDKPADSTVRHAEPAVGKQDGTGEGGFPQGEYDVTNPAPAPGQPAQAPARQLVETHLAAANVDDIKAKVKSATKLSAQEYALVLEAAPVGFIVEKEAPNRWRAHQTGRNQFGHGETAQEAVENYVMGGNATFEEAGARAFARLSAADQQAIRERDANASGGGDVNPQREQARRQALKQAGSGSASASSGSTSSSSQPAAKKTAKKASQSRKAAARRVSAKKSGAKKSSRKR